jgi:proteic killer suppression protein
VEVDAEGKQLAKVCSDATFMTRKLGTTRAAVLQRRLKQLNAATCLEDLRNTPGRCHELTADRAGQLSVDLDGPYRLFFRPAEAPAPKKPDGGLDWEAVTGVTVVEIADPH